ncbi:CaiB/BaiF CoA transferase family protein [Tsukamurella tyrosinosolvens]|uniref:CaiB/BaiF CoA transferase family protein n=1 Tax=Tsukamurella tyrosinosolvens TaxID=57704 RepID=UPI000C7F3D3B|nr:CoA transferase [Tsukamurella tyrosinosolvens]AUN41880.1 CoA transferase [Tsukamurella tyrosinosolvens]
MSGPLAGVKVLDMTHALAGPYCTMLLADLGADVLKVESPSGDLSRTSGPYLPDDEAKDFGGYFQSVNRGKRSIVLNLKDPADVAVFTKLVIESDVLVENFTPGVMDRLELSYETLAEINPKLVYAALRGFGDARSGTSPYQEWPAFDIVVQAMAGLMGITGLPDGTPIKVGPGVGDIFPGTLLSVGVVSALYETRGSGVGQFVDVAMYDAVLSLCERIVYQYSYDGTIPRPEGNRHPLLSPFDIVPAVDGWVAIAAPNNNRWKLLCDLIGRDDLASDPGLQTNESRVARREDVFGALAEWTSMRKTDEILDVLGGKVPVGAVRDAKEILEDPHVEARGMAVRLEHPGSSKVVTVAGQPIKFSRTPAVPTKRAPLLNEHGPQIREHLAE